MTSAATLHLRANPSPPTTIQYYHQWWEGGGGGFGGSQRPIVTTHIGRGVTDSLGVFFSPNQKKDTPTLDGGHAN